MREILFKAKRIDTGEWVEGYLVKAKWYLDEKEMYVIAPTDVCFYPHCEISEWHEVDLNTICQYTGLTDKNGNNIWENDVLKKVDTNALGWVRERYCKVSFDKMGYWMITTEYGDGYWICEFESEQLEVIGNIFDNPELVKE